MLNLLETSRSSSQKIKLSDLQVPSFNNLFKRLHLFLELFNKIELYLISDSRINVVHLFLYNLYAYLFSWQELEINVLYNLFLFNISFLIDLPTHGNLFLELLD